MSDPARHDPLRPFGVTVQDLAPADVRSTRFDWTDLNVHRVDTADDPNFERGYHALWNEFGAKNELESRDVIERRLAWRPETPTADGYALCYEMVVVARPDGTLAAVRDHTAIIDVRRPTRDGVVHLSHLLVTPPWRGSGLAGWMRAMPLSTARKGLHRAGEPLRPVTLVAEMEPANPADVANVRRLTAYEKVGFKKIDPARIDYLQPDFRRPEQIDADGVARPLPLSLIIRRVGREHAATVSGSEVRAIVESLYAMYGQSFRARDMDANRASLRAYPADAATIALVPPSRST